MGLSLQQALKEVSLSEELKNTTETIFNIFLDRDISIDNLNPSIIRLVSMCLNNKQYSVVGKIQDSVINGTSNTGAQPVAGYRFEDMEGNPYNLRLEDALTIIRLGKVINAKESFTKPYLTGINVDLRTLPHYIVNPSELFNEAEWKIHLEHLSDLRKHLE
ncbi:hypothetical protein [Paenibacillus etheri]|uniref:Uncharacterized protein n=1 Tax=Paenibacillus etheri TaxID=1306852 RepID=A0A0W1AWN5_9BACL|nr:hypothetical protein [Paenibacillus etheri]KTD85684.1 hypothetical protein UQ64_19525 [Paenibacillus etheri]